jgi:hypothetical protein
MTITVKLELRIGLLARQQIGRSLVSVSNRQHVTRRLDAGHHGVQEVYDVTYVPIADSTF